MNPFHGSPPQEVLLSHAPLDTVLCQVRFPPILSIGKDDFVAPFQEAIRKDYPLTEQWMVQSLPFPFQAPGGAPPQGLPITKTYRFSTPDRSWRLNLAPDSLSLDTSRYTHRTEFLERLSQALTTLAAHVPLTHWSRLGIRYVDRIRGENLARVPEFFRPEMLGILGMDGIGKHLKQGLSEALLEVEEGNLAIRYGLLPGGKTIDPLGIPVDPADSWILDLDGFQEHAETLKPFETQDVIAQTEALSKRIYAFFRWMVLPPFDQTYGG